MQVLGTLLEIALEIVGLLVQKTVVNVFLKHFNVEACARQLNFFQVLIEKYLRYVSIQICFTGTRMRKPKNAVKNQPRTVLCSTLFSPVFQCMVKQMVLKR